MVDVLTIYTILGGLFSWCKKKKCNWAFVGLNIIKDRINDKEKLLEVNITAIIAINKLQGSINIDTVYLF